MADRIYTASPNTGEAFLGHTLPELLYHAEKNFASDRSFNHVEGGEWRAWSLTSFREEAETLALGLRDLGLKEGSKVGFFMESDVYFCIADMACLIAGFVSVPIYLTQTDEAITYVLNHAEASTLIVTNQKLLKKVTPLLPETGVTTVLVATDEPLTSRSIDGVAIWLTSETESRGREIQKSRRMVHAILPRHVHLMILRL